MAIAVFAIATIFAMIFVSTPGGNPIAALAVFAIWVVSGVTVLAQILRRKK